LVKSLKKHNLFILLFFFLKFENETFSKRFFQAFSIDKCNTKRGCTYTEYC